MVDLEEGDGRRSKAVGVALTPEEYELIRQAAYESRQSMSGFVRSAALEKAQSENKKRRK